MRSHKLLALLFCLITFPAIAGYMTLLGAGVGSIAPTVSWIAGTDAFPSTSLTYSGPSLSTMFDSTGKLTYRPNNLLTQSNTFSNAAWTKNANASITSGVSDPFGGTNAFTYTATGANADIYQNVTGNSTTNYISSIWIRRRTGTGVVTYYKPNDSGSTNIAPSLTSSWQQFFATSVGAAGTAWLDLVIATNGDAIDIYAATLSAVTYETTPRAGDQVITTSAAYYGPRIDYTYNGSSWVPAGLLVEGAATNLAINSSVLTGGSWAAANMVKGSDATLDLTGATALKLTANAGAASHHLESVSANISVTSGTAYTQSWYVKAGTYTKAVVNVGAGANWAAAVFDISGTADLAATQTAAGGDTGVSGTSKYLGGGWFRLSLTATASSTGTRFSEIGLAGATTGNAFGGFGETNFTAAGTETIYVGQPQTETGSFASSYTPTGASAVTRATDGVTFTGYTSNPFAILSAPESTGSYACNKYASQAAAISGVASPNQWVKSVKIWPVGTPSVAQSC